MFTKLSSGADPLPHAPNHRPAPADSLLHTVYSKTCLLHILLIKAYCALSSD